MLGRALRSRQVRYFGGAIGVARAGAAVDGRPSELLGGQIVYRAMATFDHGAAQGGVFSQVFGSQGAGNK